MMPVLELDVHCRQGARTSAIRACCEAGLYQVTGPGASWLLHMLASGHIGRYGTATLDGFALRGTVISMTANDGRRPVVAWFEGDAAPSLLTPLRWTLTPLRAYGVPRDAAVARARRFLRRCAALHLAHRPIWTLSAADRQRVAMARALAQVPGLLLLERPELPFAAAERRALFSLLAAAAAEWEMVVLACPNVLLDGVRVLGAA